MNKIELSSNGEDLTFHNSNPFKDFYSNTFCRMAFRKLYYEWPLPGYTRPVRLDYIKCWLDGEDIFVDMFSRDTYRPEYLTISPRTLSWTILFDFLLDKVEKKFPGRRGDREYRDLVNLVE